MRRDGRPKQQARDLGRFRPICQLALLVLEREVAGDRVPGEEQEARPILDHRLLRVGQRRRRLDREVLDADRAQQKLEVLPEGERPQPERARLPERARG